MNTEAPPAEANPLEFPTSFGSDIAAAFTQIQTEEALKTHNVQPDKKVEVEQQKPVAPVAEEDPKKKEEKKPHKIEISDDPFSGLDSDQPVEEKPPGEDEPDFDAETEEKFKDEPADPKGKAKWGELKTERASLKKSNFQLERTKAVQAQRIQELEAKLADPSAQASDVYKEKYEQLINGNAFLALQADEEFQQKIAAPYQQAQSYIDSAIAHFGIDVKALDEALTEQNPFARDRKIDEVLSAAKNEDMLPGHKTSFMQALTQEQAFRGKYEEAQKKALDLYEAAQQKKVQAVQQTYQERQKQVKEIEPQMFDFLSKNKEFKEVFNGSAQDLREKVMRALDKPEVEPRVAVLREYATLAFRPLLSYASQLRQELKEKDEVIARYSNGGANPAAGVTPAGQERRVDEEDEKAEAGSIFANAMKELNGGRKVWTS